MSIKIKLASLLVVAVMICAGAFVLFSVPVNAEKDYQELIAIDGDVKARESANAPREVYSVMASGSSISDLSEPVPLGAVKGYVFYDFYNNWYDMTSVTKWGEGEHCEVWVQDDLSFPSGHSRNEGSRYLIDQSNVDMIIEEFDDVIFPMESQYFSDPPELNGSNSAIDDAFGEPAGTFDTFTTDDGSKTIIMIMNIKDEIFYDDSYPYYTVGYFSSTSDWLYDRNIIHIDCWDWKNRTGDQSATSNPARSYLYEATVAHEYQHLLHEYVDPDEELYINEGCADYAELLCGYGKYSITGHVAAFLLTPNNSLVDWEDQSDWNVLADYGAAALFMVYINDHFGGAPALSALFHNELNGAAGVTQTVKSLGFTDWDFDKVFRYWRLANLIRADQPGNGWYNYESLDLDEIASLAVYGTYPGVIDWNYRSDLLGQTYVEGEGVGDTVNAYGTDYISLDRGAMRVSDRAKYNLQFQGDKYDEVGWSYALGDWWWSGEGNNLDYSLQGKVDLTGSGDHVMQIYTYFNIETGWDFGFVQVSEDGKEWVSIPGSMTTDEADPNADGRLVTELPGLTGYSEGPVWVSYDLSAWTGKVIDLRFRYMTDSAVNGAAEADLGWFIEYVWLDGDYIEYSGYMNTFQPIYPEVDWMISIVYYRGGVVVGLKDVTMEDAWDWGMYRIWSLSTLTSAVLVVSPTAGHADYQFCIQKSVVL